MNLVVSFIPSHNQQLVKLSKQARAMALLNDNSKTLIHLFSVVMFGFACYYDWNYVKIPKSVHRMGIDYAGKLKFLTFWDAVSIL